MWNARLHGKVTRVVVDAENRKAQVWVDNNQESIAIGKEGVNVKLASRLTGFEIDLMRETVAAESKARAREKAEEYDIDLSEFKEELGEELLTKFLDDGYMTARNVIDATDEEIQADINISQDEIVKIKEMMLKELEEEPDSETEDETVSTEPAGKGRTASSASAEEDVQPSAQTPRTGQAVAKDSSGESSTPKEINSVEHIKSSEEVPTERTNSEKVEAQKPVEEDASEDEK